MVPRKVRRGTGDFAQFFGVVSCDGRRQGQTSLAGPAVTSKSLPSGKGSMVQGNKPCVARLITGSSLRFVLDLRKTVLFSEPTISSLTRKVPPNPPRSPASVTGTTSAVLSPDGHTFAFASPVGVVNQIFVMLSSGGDPLQLTNDATDKSVNSFSPDGTQIYYQTQWGGGEVWNVPTLGGTPTRVVAGRNLIPSPADGSLFFFMRQPREGHIFCSGGMRKVVG